MAQPKSGDTVIVHYTGTLADGTIFDSSLQRDPLVFTLGAGQVIRGFEEAVLGMQMGETKLTTIMAAEAYGEHDRNLVIAVDRTDLPPNFDPTIGDRYQMQQPNGMVVIVTVADISNDQVTLDANHPLAGQDLTFELELVAIQ